MPFFNAETPGRRDKTYEFFPIFPAPRRLGVNTRKRKTLYRPSLTITDVEMFVVLEAKSAPKFHSIVGEKVRPMPPVK